MAGPKTYRALAALYVDERYIREGEVFTTAAPAGSAWQEIKPKADPLDHDENGRKGGSKAKARTGADGQSDAPVTGADD